MAAEYAPKECRCGSRVARGAGGWTCTGCRAWYPSGSEGLGFPPHLCKRCDKRGKLTDGLCYRCQVAFRKSLRDHQRKQEREARAIERRRRHPWVCPCGKRFSNATAERAIHGRRGCPKCGSHDLRLELGEARPVLAPPVGPSQMALFGEVA